MNPTAAVMLVQESIRPCKVEYDPDNQYNNKGAQHTQFFKCLDPAVKKGDLVIVSTTTRHGMTVAKVVAIGVADVPVDFSNSVINWGWIIGPIPQAQYEAILETEKKIVGRVQEANTNKLKKELQEAMGLGAVDFKDLDLTQAGKPALAAPEPPKKPNTGSDRYEDMPEAPPHSKYEGPDDEVPF